MSQGFPHTGFHFRVSFMIPGTKDLSPVEAHFQSVSGLDGGFSSVNYAEGGIAGYSHKLTDRSSFGPLVLKRGMTEDKALSRWCEATFLTMRTVPVNVLVSLLDSKQEPVENWLVIHAIPTKLNTSGFDATSSQVVMETLTMDYQYFIRV
ncbi:MAG TPA: phage tail protein [Bacteroidetes bacterium]|nr:phage tail protein [Bacteroidota bacterium]